MKPRKCVVHKCRYPPIIIIGYCKYCNKSFCINHRLPESHNCDNLDDCRKESYEKNKLIKLYDNHGLHKID